MKVKSRFEELDYNYFEDEFAISYFRKESIVNGFIMGSYIIFYKDDKTITKTNYKFQELKGLEVSEGYITLTELKLIQEQVNNLKWKED